MIDTWFKDDLQRIFAQHLLQYLLMKAAMLIFC